MATKKKTTLTRKPGASAARPRSYSELYKGDKTRTAQVVTTATSATASPEVMNWREEYAYVVRDLRTLGLVSAVLFGAIIIVGFFI